MTKLIITIGLPASSKTTWANAYIKKSGGNYKIVCMDDLRRMLDNGKYSKTNEKTMQRIQRLIVADLLTNDTNVIVADTNLSAKKQKMWSQFAKERSCSFERKSFLDVDVATCIKRDLTRLHSVGKDVIMRMYKEHVKPLQKQRIYVPNTSNPPAITVDLDGTLALMSGRSPYEWHRVGEDSLCDSVARVVSALGVTHKIILMSGRDGVCRPETEQWLEDNKIEYDKLYMRVEGDCRKDTIVKEEIFFDNIADNYNVIFGLDDRACVVEKFRDMGIKIFQVSEGNF